MKLLVVGAAGLLGRYVVREAQARVGHETTRWVRSLDVPDPRSIAGDVRRREDVDRILDAVRPEAVINCAGALHQHHPPASDLTAVNAWFPRYLAERLERLGARVVHVSTDAVFDGRRGDYTETDPISPEGAYALSKALGEPGEPHVSVRTCFVGRRSHGGVGLLDWLLRQSGRVEGHANAFCTCIGAPVLARVLLDLAERPDVGGVLHVGGPRISKFQICRDLATAFGRSEIRVVPVPLPMLDRSLRSARLAALGFSLPPPTEQWREIAALEGAASVG